MIPVRVRLGALTRLEYKLLRCEFSDLRITGRKNNASKRIACTRKPEWIIRKNGSERHACKVHKTEGVIVRKIG